MNTLHDSGLNSGWAEPKATALLVLAGEASPSWPLGLACLLIAGGAALASRELWAGTR